jgi:hypothetical protein
MNRWLIILLLAIVHFIASEIFAATGFVLCMDRFDTGSLEPSLVERAIATCNEVLQFPVVTGVFQTEPMLRGLAGHLPFILNSLLWAVAILVLFRTLRRLAVSVGTAWRGY